MKAPAPAAPAGPDTLALLERIAELARAGGRIALDTEFMGEGRYRTLLCLIQLAVADGDAEQLIEILDPLSELLPSEPLARVLADPSVELIVHAGRQDIALLRRALSCDARNVFDTQIAAGFLGLAAQSSYETLLSELLGVKLAKTASFTRWDARPLSPEQLSYAREDVVHLLALADELERRLDAVGRLRWAREECEFLEQMSDERDLETVFRRLPRVHGMSAASQGVARELVAWRERTAAERDRPVQSVLADAALVEIAKRRPSSTRKLGEIRGVNLGSLRRRGEDLLAAVERGLQNTHEPLPTGARPVQPSPQDAPLIALCESLARARSREAELAYELLASRADLQAIVAGEREQVRTLRGWRRELVGEDLLALLDGRRALSISADRSVQVARC